MTILVASEAADQTKISSNALARKPVKKAHSFVLQKTHEFFVWWAMEAQRLYNLNRSFENGAAPTKQRESWRGLMCASAAPASVKIERKSNLLSPALQRVLDRWMGFI